MCGEKCLDVPHVFTGSGSPPHVRGKEFFHLINEPVVGITPACAGKSILDQPYVKLL